MNGLTEGMIEQYCCLCESVVSSIPVGPPRPLLLYLRLIESDFIRGAYRQTLDRIQEALVVYPQSADLKLWKAITLEALGNTSEALVQARPLARHPDVETAKQAKYLISIWEAPRLQRPQTLITQIPDLSQLSEDSWNLTSLAPSSALSKSPPPPQSPSYQANQSSGWFESKRIWVTLSLGLGITLMWLLHSVVS